jgi:DNA-binding NarL/FixJ family response regulator
MTIRVVIVDDQPLIRTGLRASIDYAADLEVVGEAGDGAEGLAVTSRAVPDVVLMDIRMPGIDGLEATRQITADKALSAVRVIILTTFDLDRYVYDAIRGGASGFLLKDTRPEEILAAIRVVAAGDALLSPRVTRRLIEDYAQRPEETPSRATALDALTDREREVLTLVGRGYSNAEIGERLFVSPLTAKTHVSHIMTKLGARDRVQLVVTAYECRLVRPGE